MHPIRPITNRSIQFPYLTKVNWKKITQNPTISSIVGAERVQVHVFTYVSGATYTYCCTESLARYVVAYIVSLHTHSLTHTYAVVRPVYGERGRINWMWDACNRIQINENILIFFSLLFYAF